MLRLKKRLEVLEGTAKAVLRESKSQLRDKDYFKRNTILPPEPIFIASTEDIGTPRVRANHVDACIDYYMEQEYLKKNKVPL